MQIFKCLKSFGKGLFTTHESIERRMPCIDSRSVLSEIVNIGKGK
jgi:hypothetical protein